jgi:hypothetical protein
MPSANPVSPLASIATPTSISEMLAGSLKPDSPSRTTLEQDRVRCQGSDLSIGEGAEALRGDGVDLPRGGPEREDCGASGSPIG